MRRLSGDEGTELPEGLAGAGTPAAVDAMGEVGGDAPRLEHEVRHPVGQRESALRFAATW
jgi:hypothetical protein